MPTVVDAPVTVVLTGCAVNKIVPQTNRLSEKGSLLQQ